VNGPIAQIVALTCYGNAFLISRDVPEFFPSNSTCQFCDRISFVAQRKGLLGRFRATENFDSPDEWIAALPVRRVKGIRLDCRPRNAPTLSDRMSAGFVGGGRRWAMELMCGNGQSEFWADDWHVWNQNAPDRRIWRVTYSEIGAGETHPYTGRPLDEVMKDLHACLTDILRFSERQSSGGFTECFSNALIALEDPGADVGYHKDIAPPGLLTDAAKSMLKASMSAWVFGGMGSWNDMGFDGDVQAEYEAVSERAFSIINEAIATAATSTAPAE
jgi:hypothetical protein